MNRKTKRIVFSAFQLLVMLFSACTADPAPKYPEYENLTFDAACLDFLGKPSVEVAKMLETEAAWEYLYDDAGNPNPRPTRAEPVTIAGNDYTVYVRFDPVCAWGYSYECRIESTDDAEKNQAVQEVFDLLYEELGEPEELVRAHSLREGLEKGLAGPDYYTEWWVLDENIKIEAENELTYYLTCRPVVEYAADYVVISVTYGLYNHEKNFNSKFQEIKRYTEMA